MTDSGADALRREWDTAFAEWFVSDKVSDSESEFSAAMRKAFHAGCASQKRRDAAIARGEKVDVYGSGDDSLTPAERQKAEKWLKDVYQAACENEYDYVPHEQYVRDLALYASSCERAAVEKCLQLVKSSAAPSGVDAAIRREFESLLSEEKP